MCITQLGHKFKLTVDDFFDPFSQKPLYVERVVECRYVSSATKNFGVSQVPEWICGIRHSHTRYKHGYVGPTRICTYVPFQESTAFIDTYRQ